MNPELMSLLLSPAQWLGYAAFVAGVGCFLQTDDRRFKQLMALECLAYVLHFWLLGQPTAVASSLVSLSRALVALRWRSPALAGVYLAMNAALGWWLFAGWLSLLPLLASSLGSVALFLLQGLPMRLLMLAGTLCWVLNNVLVGSVGGTLLELVVAGVNSLTIWRMWRRARSAAPAQSPP